MKPISILTSTHCIAQASVKSHDNLDIKLIYSNKTKDDILCKDLLDELAKISDKFLVHYTLTRHDPNKHGKWKKAEGRINIGMMKYCGLPLPSDKVLILICGPNSFTQTMKDILNSEGYVENVMYVIM